MAGMFSKHKARGEQEYRDNLVQGNKTHKDDTARLHLVSPTKEEPSPFSVKRDWALTIVATAMFLVASVTNIYFAYKRGDIDEAKYLWTAIGICFEAAAFFLLQRCKYLGERKQKLMAFLALLACGVCLYYNVPNTYGFLSTSLNDKAIAKEERVSPEVALLQRKLEAASRAKEAECLKRGELCRGKENAETEAFNALQKVMGTIKTEARANDHVTNTWLWFVAVMLQCLPTLILLVAANRR